jgi:hypothetical protein
VGEIGKPFDRPNWGMEGVDAAKRQGNLGLRSLINISGSDAKIWALCWTYMDEENFEVWKRDAEFVMETLRPGDSRKRGTDFDVWYGATYMLREIASFRTENGRGVVMAMIEALKGRDGDYSDYIRLLRDI